VGKSARTATRRRGRGFTKNSKMGNIRRRKHGKKARWKKGNGGEMRNDGPKRAGGMCKGDNQAKKALLKTRGDGERWGGKGKEEQNPKKKRSETIEKLAIQRSTETGKKGPLVSRKKNADGTCQHNRGPSGGVNKKTGGPLRRGRKQQGLRRMLVEKTSGKAN